MFYASSVNVRASEMIKQGKFIGPQREIFFLTSICEASILEIWTHFHIKATLESTPRKKDDIDKVKKIIKELDEFEYDYLPEDLIATFDEYPKLAYTHKFDALYMNVFSATCWKRGIHILIIDNGSNEYLENPV